MNSSRTLLVGAGPMAVAYAKAMASAGIQFDAVGRGSASAEHFLAQTGVRAGTGELGIQLAGLAQVPANAIVAVGVPELPAVVEQLLTHGVARVLVEKPGAPSLAQMEKLADLDSDSRISVAYNRRFLKSTIAAKRLILEDGGAQSFHFEFTELPDRVAAANHPALVLENWALANSSHVMDMAFYLAGAEESLADVAISGTAAAGHLDWHSAGSRFAGCGYVAQTATFSYCADWGSGGGWGVELCTPKRKLRLRPLESLTEQIAGQFKIESVAISAEQDGLKPGLPGLLGHFLGGARDALPTASQQVARMRKFRALLGLSDA